MGYFKKLTTEKSVKARSLKWTVSMFTIILLLIKYLNHIAYK